MGVMGMLHAGTLNSLKNVKVVAVTEPEKLVVKFIQTFLPNIKVYENYVEMLKKENLDFVYITTPVKSHVLIAEYCAKNNIPFFVEKPLSKTATECEELCKILNKNSITNMVGFNLRYSSTFTKAKELLDKKAIGDILNVKATAYRTLVLKEGTGWRFKKESSGGGVLIDIGIHVIDLLLLFFGKIKNVSTEKISFVIPEIDDSVTGLLRFENGLTCIFETSWNVKNYRLQETTLEINGTLGKIKVNEDYVKIQYFESDKKPHEDVLYRQSLYKGVHLDIGGSMYASEDADFVNCLENGTQPGSNVINSIQVQSVIDSIYKSSKSNKQEGVIYIE